MKNSKPQEHSASAADAFDTVENYPAADATQQTEKRELTGQESYPCGDSQYTGQEPVLGEDTTPAGRQNTNTLAENEDIEIHDWDGPDDPDNP